MINDINGYIAQPCYNHCQRYRAIASTAWSTIGRPLIMSPMCDCCRPTEDVSNSSKKHANTAACPTQHPSHEEEPVFVEKRGQRRWDRGAKSAGRAILPGSPSRFKLAGPWSPEENRKGVCFSFFKLMELKLTVDGLEKERDFYFGKLRDIELICQEPESESHPILSKIMDILYATEVAFHASPVHQHQPCRALSVCKLRSFTRVPFLAWFAGRFCTSRRWWPGRTSSPGPRWILIPLKTPSSLSFLT